MTSTQLMRIEPLDKDNFDTWRIQMQALLTRNELWGYVCGNVSKPEASEPEILRKWEADDNKAKADIILSIKPSELKQTKDCRTSRELWLKLERTYQSTGPARKATLIKQLTLHRMGESEDIGNHLSKFFDTADKLGEMGVEINPDLLCVMLLYSLPKSYTNFRCAIESRDTLPTPEALRLKILEENDSRKNENREDNPNAMFVKGRTTERRSKQKTGGRKDKKGQLSEKKETFKYKCHRCRKIGHKAADCTEEIQRNNDANAVDQLSLCAVLNALSVQKVNSCDSDYQKPPPEKSANPETLYARKSINAETWCIDSGCTTHMCNDASSFTSNFSEGKDKVSLASHASSQVTGTGSICFNVEQDDRNKKVILDNALCVPDLRLNLLSVGRICDKNMTVIFKRDEARIMDKNQNMVLKASRTENGLYCLQPAFGESSANVESKTNENSPPSSIGVCHRLLGHLNYKDITRAIERGAIKGIKPEKHSKNDVCEICIKAKMTRTPFTRKEINRKTDVLEIIHTDICGPMRSESLAKSRYFIIFVDDATRWCEIRFLRQKSEALEAFKNFKALAENHTGKRIRYLQSDNGREYLSSQFEEYLKNCGIQRRLTVPHTPQQNGVAERKNRTLLDMARCLIIESSMPKFLWAEAVNTANYLRNRCPSISLNGRTPYEKWTGKIPNLNYFKIFGSRMAIRNLEPQKDKFDARSSTGIFVGYSEISKAYRVWIPHKRRIEIARDVKIIDENPETYPLKDKSLHEQSKPETEVDRSEIIFPVTHPQTEEEDSTDEVRPGVTNQEESEDASSQDTSVTSRKARGRPRILRTGSRGRPRRIFNTVEQAQETTDIVGVSEINLKEAVQGINAEDWNRAIASELKSIIKNDAWEMVPRPDTGKILGSRLVLRHKFAQDGTVERYKARIVAKGFAQVPGVDFDDTFAPVARLESIRLIASLAAKHQMKIYHFDVSTAFLNGTLKETVYMESPTHIEEGLRILKETEPPKSYVRQRASQIIRELKKGDRVCLLKRALYGLRQAGRCWYETLAEKLLSFGAKKSTADPCVFIKRNKEIMIIATYVDDIIVACKESSSVDELYKHLANDLEMKNLGEISSCLGMEFKQNNGDICITQRNYTESVLNRFEMANATPAIPLEPNCKIDKANKKEANESKRPYQELIGSLMYLAVSTRPDIAHAVNFLSQFNTCHEEKHWSAAKRILRYLRGTIDHGLNYSEKGEEIKGYADADWANDGTDRRSYTSYVFVSSGCPISWASRKQKTTALSSTEAEYMALCEAAKEAHYLRRFLGEIGIDEKPKIQIMCDNNGARKLAENPVFHARTKHIDVRHHFVREALCQGIISIEHVGTTDMAADFLTKGVPGPKYRHCLELLGMIKK